MQKNPQRRLNSSTPKPTITDPPNIARDGSVAKKALNPTPIKDGMKSQTRPGGVHPWLHGQAAPLDDEPNLPLKSHEKPIPWHDGMTDKQVIGVVNSATSGQVLHDAARLGRGDKA